MRQLASRGARPFLLISTRPYTGSDEAAAWWREVAKVADLVPEVYFGGPSLYVQGPIVASRRIRVAMRDRLSRFLAIGIPASRLGVVLGFQTGRGAGGREGLQPDAAWYEVIKWQALAARQVVAEYRIASVWSWGWGTYNRNADDDDKPNAMCVYLWTRAPGLCDGLAAAGPAFRASRTEGQIRLPASRKCGFVGGGGFDSGSVGVLQQVTGDRSLALTILLARTAESRAAVVPYSRVLAAERAVIASRFGGSAGAYRAALGRREGERGRGARGARRRAAAPRARADDERPEPGLERGLDLLPVLPRPAHARASGRSPHPGGSGTRRPVSPSPRSRRRRSSRSPPAAHARLRALDGTYTVTASGEAQPLGSVPLAQARPAIAAALRAFARRAAFEAWSTARQENLMKTIVCTRDELPSPGAVRLTSFLPFLSLTTGVSGAAAR